MGLNISQSYITNLGGIFMKRTMVEVKIRRFVYDGDEMFEVVFAYGDAAEGEVKLPENLDEEVASNACYFARKACGGGMNGMIYYDYRKKCFHSSLERRSEMNRMFYRAYCKDESALWNVLCYVKSGQENLDLQGKIVIRWAGDLKYVPEELKKSGDRISIYA